MSCGIYKITNLINGHSYIGESVNIERRFSEHKHMKYESSLYYAFTKYGIDNFSFEIIEECPPDVLSEREKYWIAFFDTYQNGYNRTMGGEGGPASGKRRKIAQYDLNGNFIQSFESIVDAENKLHIKSNTSNISKACALKTFESNGYQWRYIDEININTYKNNIGISPLKQHKIENALKTSQKRTDDSYDELIRVAKCALNNQNIIEIYDSVKDAALSINRTKNYSGIYNVLKGKARSAYGYMWYKVDKNNKICQ